MIGLPNLRVIILGDLNLIFKESEKRNKLYTSNDKRIGKVIGCLFRDANLVDIWSNQTEFT